MIDKQKPAPLAGSGSGLSSGNFFDELSAAEGHNRILVSGCPRFGVAIDEGDVSRILDMIHAALEEPLILVLSIDHSDGAILFDEGDGKELSFGFRDQVIEFSLHGHFFFGLFGRSMGFFRGFVNNQFTGEDHKDRSESEEESEGGEHKGIEHGVGVVGWLRGELRRVGRVCQHYS